MKKKGDAIPTTPEDEILFTSLRAQTWNEFHGQKRTRDALETALKAATQRKEPLEHVLFYGPPGLGKTTLSYLIANHMGTNLRTTSGPMLTRSSDIASILTNLEPGDILFIDEIHRIGKSVEELLYSAMEDFFLDIIIGKGPGARSVRIDLPHFTLIGATTRVGMLSSPLRDRFGHLHRIEFYSPNELSAILQQAAVKLQTVIETPLLLHIAKRSRGTPRIALKLLKRARDVAQVHGNGSITETILDKTFAMLDINEHGLDANDRQYLSVIKKHKNSPVGLDTLAATLSEDKETLEDVVEPYLLQAGFLKRTPKGRMLTEEGMRLF